jgi:hypothetical protein
VRDDVTFTDYFGYVASFLFDALLPRGVTDGELLGQLSRFVVELADDDPQRASSIETPTRLSTAEFHRFCSDLSLACPSIYLPGTLTCTHACSSRAQPHSASDRGE